MTASDAADASSAEHAARIPPPQSAGEWSRKRLQIYLSDHRGGAAGGLALARRAAERNRGTPLGLDLAQIAEQIEEDVQSLDRAAELLHVRTSVVKRAFGALGERVARLKPNGQLRGYSPLSRMLELEALLAGIDAKRSLWRALAAAGEDGLRAAGLDPDELARRAKEQRRQLIPHHQEAARDALIERAPLRAAPTDGRGADDDGLGDQRGLP